MDGCAAEVGVQEEDAISTGPEAVMEYTAQLLAVMQDQAEERGGVATLGQSSCAVERTLSADLHPDVLYCSAGLSQALASAHYHDFARSCYLTGGTFGVKAMKPALDIH